MKSEAIMLLKEYLKTKNLLEFSQMKEDFGVNFILLKFFLV